MSAHPGDAVVLDVDIELGGDELAAVSLEIGFDADLLALEEVDASHGLAAGGLLAHTTADVVSERVLRLALAMDEPASGTGSLLRLIFRLSEQAPFGVVSSVRLGSAVLETSSGGPLSVELQDGSLRVGGPPTLWTNAGLSLDEGATATIDTDELEIRDPDTPADALTFTLVQVPSHGDLLLHGVRLGAGDTFTQAQVDASALGYGHDDSETVADAFRFRVGDEQGAAVDDETFAITVVPVDDPVTLTMELLDSAGAPLANRVVALRRSDGSRAGRRQRTDANGLAVLDVRADETYHLRVYDSGGSYTTPVLIPGVTVTVRTAPSRLTLVDSRGEPITGQRVDLLRATGSRAGVRVDTDAAGEAVFELLPDYDHRFRVRHHGLDLDTDIVAFDASVTIETRRTVLRLVDGDGAAIVEARVDLLRQNRSSTGVRTLTDDEGLAAFEVLPGATVRFRVRWQSTTVTTEPVAAGGTSEVVVEVRARDLTLRLRNSHGNPIPGVRVDLLRENGSSTGTRRQTGVDGSATFTVLPGVVHRLRVQHNGGLHDTEAVTGGTTIEVQTGLSALTFTDHHGAAIAGARVFLRRANGSSAGVHGLTDDDGVIGFECLPGYEHRFRVYFGGLQAQSAKVVFDADAALATLLTTLSLTDAGGAPIPEIRVDLLRARGSSTGVRTETDADGIAAFEVLPDNEVRFRVRLSGATEVTEPVPAGGTVSMGGGQVQATELALVLQDSQSQPLDGVRVDLLRENGSSTGKRLRTDDDGRVVFTVLPSAVHRLRIRHNGGTYVTEPAAGGTTVAVQTALSTLTLTDHDGVGIPNQWVFLRRESGSSAGVYRRTDASGVAAFEILPEFAHRFRVYYHGGRYDSQVVVFGDDVLVQTESSTLTVLDGGQPVDGIRVDLRGTGVRTETDDAGVAEFDVLPEFEHRFRARIGRRWETTDWLVGGDDAVLDVGSAKPLATGSPVVDALDGNHPNPFNPATTIRFSLAAPAAVTLAVFDLTGQRIRTLVEAGTAAGAHEAVWDGRDEAGRRVASATYLVRLRAVGDEGAFVRNHKVLLLR